MNSQNITFKNSNGEALSARLELPVDKSPHAYALFAHCFTCNKDFTAIRNISSALTRHGIGVISFDFTGLGESDGKFSNTNFSSNINDLLAATEFMKDELEAPKLLIGHSLGGAAVIFAAKKIASVQAIATIGAPSSPEHVQHLFQNSLQEINQEGRAQVVISGRKFTIQKQFIDDISSKNLTDALSKLKKPVIFLHSPQDLVVEISNAAELYTAAVHPKSFVSLDGADHLLSNKKDSIYVGNVIAGWASRYIESDSRAKIINNQQVSVRIGGNKYTTDIQAGKHQLTADEPEHVGGNDFGPSPYDLLLASLGSCTAMTLKMYADHKKWDLREVIVHLEHKKDYAKDCEECESSNTKIDHISRQIELSGDLLEDQKARLLEIADKCPVHKTLYSEVKISTEMVNS